jgi:hypothetical protein
MLMCERGVPVAIGFGRCSKCLPVSHLASFGRTIYRGNMRNHIAIATLVLLFMPTITFGQQMSASAPNDISEVRGELNEALQLLQQTRKELQDSQAQIKALRSEVDSIKASLPSGAQPLATTATAVEQLTESQALTDSRVEQLYQTKVESGSKYRVSLSGMVLFNAGLNRGAVDNSDVPMLATFRRPGQTGGDINATMRQTFFNVGVTGPELRGARTSADVQFDFFGGFQNTRDGNVLGIMRLRTGHVQMEWDKGSISIEQDQPFISPLTPTSLATMGTPALGYSGNLWTWTPQIVAKRKFAWSDRMDSTIQIGVLDPFVGQFTTNDSYIRIPGPGEQTRIPAIAARHAFTVDVAGRKFTIGTSGLYNRQDYGFGRTVDGFAGTVDWMLPITSKLELSGEFFRGRAIGGMWGAIGTSIAWAGSLDNPATEVYGVNTIGGWTQLKYRPAEKWEVNTAFGIDNPYAHDLMSFSSSSVYQPTRKNSTELLNIMHRPRSNLVFSLEYRHLNTVNYFPKRYTAENVNLGIGVHF